MSDSLDFFRLFPKPAYEGDLLNLMFDWNINSEAEAREMSMIKQAVQQSEPDEGETWDQFEQNLQTLKYTAKHENALWKRERVAQKVEEFKAAPYIKDEDHLTEQQRLQQLEFKIHCDDFWKKLSDPRREKLLRKLHPLIYLKEQLPSYVKIQNNWVF